MILPNFLIIGTAKAGTTSIYNCLKQHPQIYLSPIKETNFFFLMGQKVNFKGPGDAEKINKTSITDFESYQAQFTAVNGEIAVGEISPLYMYVPATPERIHRKIPTVKLFVILRNPIDRAYSSFLHLRRDDREPLTDFVQALEKEEERIQAGWAPLWHYKALGLYHHQLRRYYDLFSPDQIRIYLYKDFVKNPSTLFQDMFRVLDIDDTFQPDLSIRRNVSGIPKYDGLHKFLTKPHFIKSTANHLLPNRVGGRAKAILSKLRNDNLQKPKLSNDLRRDLIEFYRQDIVNTQDLIGRDLSPWIDYQTS